MHELTEFHHYNDYADLSRQPVERLERHVVKLLVDNTLDDSCRESSKAFELKHSSGVLQFGRLLARQRELPLIPCQAGALLHDIYVVQHGGYKDHAHLGAPIARAILEHVGGFTESQITDTEQIVYDHSDKHVYSDEPLSEFGKDADVLDCFLYPGAFDYYLRHKSLDAFRHYLRRAQRLWRDLNIPAEPGFGLLDRWEPNWLRHMHALDQSTRGAASGDTPSPYALCSNGTKLAVATDSRVLDAAIARHARAVADSGELENSEEDVVMVWPAIDRYERLNRYRDASRLGDLGLPTSPT